MPDHEVSRRDSLAQLGGTVETAPVAEAASSLAAPRLSEAQPVAGTSAHTLYDVDQTTRSSAPGNQRRPVSSRPELDYLKLVNSAAPPQDPQLLFLLMGAFANANQPAEGAEFFAARLSEFGARLADGQKALYLSAIGLLRAQHASAVPVFQRIAYVRDTIAMLDQAKRLSGGQIFVVNIHIKTRYKPN